jgi:cellulose synthase (UDP-forming)
MDESTFPIPSNRRTDFLRMPPSRTRRSRILLALNGFFALLYFFALLFAFPIGNAWLFGLLIFGEVFHLFQLFSFLYTTADTEYEAPRFANHFPWVDVFITVAGEPLEIVEQTILAARAMQYPHFSVWVLNDGFVAKKENWRDVEDLSRRLGVGCITRTIPGGAKAGNINHALSVTDAELVAIFDADHVPHADFLMKTVQYFGDSKVGFVQTPQFYKNYAETLVTMCSWEQQELFFGPICKGRNRHNAVQMCGTNMLISREALVSVGGMCTESIAEDFITGLFIHERGYKSVYVAEVLAEGLATEDLLTYSKQQFRWARGALDVLFRYNPLFRRGLSWPQKIEYLSGASFFISGVIILIDILLPVVFFFTGLVPLRISGMLLALLFLPYLFLTFFVLQRATNFTFTFQSMAFSVGSFGIHLEALVAALTGKKSVFVITEKQRVQGNFLPLIRMHIGYVVLVVAGALVAYIREGFSASLANNVAWAIINIAIFTPFMRAALPHKKSRQKSTHSPAVSLPQAQLVS